ncbi:hypothetical protein [Rhizobium paknamense]|uniref:Phosphoribosyl-AMP cyclohydrolase n=1 Tax=Rhizobium paknamense TaxID=1206817 RepID=A0ABU0IFG2_9HYPH|nr:hypothetical protein [Rhizobium paknamense]MDQ0455991.1 hypothetical protein [Rhizobium paknamense]
MNRKSIFTVSALMTVLAAPAATWAASCTPSITEAEVQQAQQNWGKGLVAIGAAQDPKATAEKFISETYAYQDGKVLFKPTKAAVTEFRDTPDEALSYFVKGSLPEDQGFALAPYTNVRFENHAITYDCNTAISMGNYYFTGKDGSVTKVDYTMGFIKTADGKLKINIQHSSLPYVPHS